MSVVAMRRKAIDSQIAPLADRLDAVEDRLDMGSRKIAAQENGLASLEAKVDALPSRDDLHKQDLMIAEMVGEMKAMRATMRAMAEGQHRIEEMARRHDDWLINKKVEA